MKTIIIRFSERLLALVEDRIEDVSTPDSPNKLQAKAALASCLPALYDIRNNLRERSSVSKSMENLGAPYMETLIKVGFVARCI